MSPLRLVHTALEASFETREPCVASATYGVEGEGRFTTAPEASASTEHRLLLLQLPAASHVDYTLACTGDDDVTGTVDGTAVTGTLPVGLANLTLTGTPDDTDDLYTLPVLGTVMGAALIDAQGRIVWYQVHPGSHEVTRVRVTSDGVLYNVAEGGYTPDGTGAILRVGWDGEALGTYPAPLNTHDFVELPDRSVTAITTDAREVDGDMVLGDALLNVPEGGTGTVEWSAWDSFDPDVNVSFDTTESTWTHANALDYDPATDGYWLGIRNFSSINHVDRATGTITAAIGGDTPTLLYADPADATSGQHQFEWLPDGGILIFDNGYATQSSRVVEFGLSGQTLTRRWQWLPDPPVWNYALGDVERDDDGGTRVTLSTAGEIVQLDADGAVRWQMNSDLGIAFGYSDRVPPLAARAP